MVGRKAAGRKRKGCGATIPSRASPSRPLSVWGASVQRGASQDKLSKIDQIQD